MVATALNHMLGPSLPSASEPVPSHTHEADVSYPWWCTVTPHLWFSGPYLSHKHLRLHSQEQPLWRKLYSSRLYQQMDLSLLFLPDFYLLALCFKTSVSYCFSHSNSLRGKEKKWVGLLIFTQHEAPRWVEFSRTAVFLDH